MIRDKRKLQFYTSLVTTLLLILMGLFWSTHALRIYRTTLEQQMAEDNEIIKANLGIIIDQVTKQYGRKDQVIAQVQNVLEALANKGWSGFACVLDDQGHVLAHPNKNMVGMRPPVETYEPQSFFGQIPPPVTQLPNAGQQASAIYRTQSEIIAIDWLPNLMTYLCVHKSHRPIQTQLDALRRRLGGVGLVLILFSGTGAWFLVGWIVDKYENHLTRSEHRNRTLVQNSAPILITTLQGQILDLNPAAETLFESSRHELLNTSIEKVWSPTQTDKLKSLLQVAPDHTAECHDLDLLTTNKKIKPTDIRTCQIEYDNQDAIYFLLRDVSENRRAREEILAANKRLRELDQLKTDFINTVSHELRTPLTSMHWSTESLAQLLNQNDETIAKLLRIMRDDNHRLAHMIEELLGFARLDAGKLKLNLEESDVKMILKHAREEILPLAQQKEITIKEVQGPDSFLAKVDAEQLHRIIINLLDNAIKYTHPHGQVLIDLTHTEIDFKISIQDTGIGIGQEDQTQIFEKFYRTDQKDVQKERGTGLGLAIVKGIADAHGGTIQVKSAVDQGTTFEIILPYHPQKS